MKQMRRNGARHGAHVAVVQRELLPLVFTISSGDVRCSVDTAMLQGGMRGGKRVVRTAVMIWGGGGGVVRGVRLVCNRKGQARNCLGPPSERGPWKLMAPRHLLPGGPKVP